MVVALVVQSIMVVKEEKEGEGEVKERVEINIQIQYKRRILGR